MRAALAFCLLPLAAVGADAALEWKYYLASIAAADGALRASQTSEAKRWLAGAPASHRDWEWRYLSALADQTMAEAESP